MLEWLHHYLAHDSGLDEADAAVVWAAVNVGFFYLLRASEFLVGPQPWSWEGVLHGRDIIGRKDGLPVVGCMGATEVVIYIKKSKTDQYNVGSTRCQFRTGGILCPVRAMQELELHFPQRVKGSELDTPIFRYKDGTPVKREHIQRYLE